ncbi:MAG: fibrillarin-like rRNA/tRNA 2'-O-methyltransferase [Euryarchaeota archaeon]|nr:fibrillarin-like rRNA/tRNA 2'-O-methyltransferase [Euryarchaeota archaeon]
MQQTAFRGVFTDRGSLFTRRLAGGSVYGERIVSAGGESFREWDIRRSKLAAAIRNGLRELPLDRDSSVLYLGAASGTTASHVSDLCPDGRVVCVEVSPRSFRDLLAVAGGRPNMFPVNADARHPERYRALLGESDLLYQDIAQRDQDDIFLRNASMFLRPGGRGMLMVKSRSIAVAERPDEVFRRVLASLERDRRLKVIQTVRLEPFHRDHLAVSVLWK